MVVRTGGESLFKARRCLQVEVSGMESTEMTEEERRKLRSNELAIGD